MEELKKYFFITFLLCMAVVAVLVSKAFCSKALAEEAMEQTYRSYDISETLEPNGRGGASLG